MEKVLFVDWGSGRNGETKVFVNEISGDGYVQDLRCKRPRVFAGDIFDRVHRIAQMIIEVNPDRVIVDSFGMGAGPSSILREVLDKMGATKYVRPETPEYKPPPQFVY